jgi:hypothetical protein
VVARARHVAVCSRVGLLATRSVAVVALLVVAVLVCVDRFDQVFGHESLTFFLFYFLNLLKFIKILMKKIKTTTLFLN